MEVDDHLSTDQLRQVDLGRYGQPSDVLRPNDIVLRLERAGGADDEAEPMPGGIDQGLRRYAVAAVVRGATEDFDRVRELLSSRELLDDERVAGARHLAGIPFAGDEDRILARPRHSLLPF